MMGNRMKWEQLLSDTTQVERESEPEEFAKYPMNDLGSVFSHWDDDLKKNVTTKNI